MGAKKKPLETKSAADVGIEADRVGYDNARAHCADFAAPPAKAAGPDHRRRGHERDGREDRRVAGREEVSGMSGILVYALHYDGAFNKNSLGAVSEGARLAAELGSECHAIVVGEGISDDLASPLGAYGATQGVPRRGPRGPRTAGRRRDGGGDRGRRPRATRCSAAACSASRSAPAWPRGSTPASAWRSPTCASRTASSSPSARSCRTRRSPPCTTAPAWA